MANTILTGAGWQQRIRDIMGIDEAYLPDTSIEQPDIISVAEANITNQVADYASLTGSDLVYLESAVVCECAILLCPSMKARLPVHEMGPQGEYETVTDWDALKSTLEARRNELLDNISQPTITYHFGLTQ